MSSTKLRLPACLKNFKRTCRDKHKVAKLFLFPKSSIDARHLAIMGASGQNTFCLNNYDAIGFDLDHTLCKYKLKPLNELIHELFVNYLVNCKNYPKDIGGTYSEACNFFQKGVVADLIKGNFLKLAADYSILLAYHGTRLMSSQEIIESYGTEKKFHVAGDILSNQCLSQPTNLNCFLFRDYFGIPAMFLSAKIIDKLDADNGGVKLEKYNFWLDLTCAFQELYRIEHFQQEIGGYFSAIKRNPHRFIKQNDPTVLNWLKELRKTKKLFVLTNSYFDIAEVLLKNCIGPDWRDYFDFVGCHSRKPGFFAAHRPYLSMKDYREGEPVPLDKLEPNGVYSQGNWSELKTLLGKMCKSKNDVKCLYFGDSILDDVYAPNCFTNCDTVAIVEEIASENDPPLHDALLELNSNVWGSFFSHEKDNQEHTTFLSSVIMKHSHIAIPDIETLAKVPIHKELPRFNLENNERNGFFIGKSVMD